MLGISSRGVGQNLDFKEWLSDEQWAAVRHAVETGTRAFSDYQKQLKKEKKKPKVKKENLKQPKQEDLHKWLLEKKLATLPVQSESGSHR